MPVTLETIGISGAAKASPSATRRNSANIGSMRGEWKAWLTASLRTLRPRDRNSSANASASSSSPETTTDVGPLTAARPIRSPIRGSTSASVASTAIIAPPPGSAAIRLARAATSVAASARDSTPAAWAAVSSPAEWPSRKSGRTPQDWNSRNNATSTAKRPGWVNPVRSSAAGSPNTTSRSGRSRCWSSSAHAASKADA